MSLDEVGHSPRRLCWFCGVEQVAAAPASYQAYLALYEMDGEVEIERRTIGYRSCRTMTARRIEGLLPPVPTHGGVAAYKRKCDEIAARGYEGFCLGVCVEEQRFAAD